MNDNDSNAIFVLQIHRLRKRSHVNTKTMGKKKSMSHLSKNTKHTLQFLKQVHLEHHLLLYNMQL